MCKESHTSNPAVYATSPNSADAAKSAVYDFAPARRWTHFVDALAFSARSSAEMPIEEAATAEGEVRPLCNTPAVSVSDECNCFEKNSLARNMDSPFRAIFDVRQLSEQHCYIRSSARHSQGG
jgi:hypothetical protein